MMKKDFPGAGPLMLRPDVDFADYIRTHGFGGNSLRTARVVQPGALRIGDILATGDKVLSFPREGGNGSVLIHLTGGYEGHWIGVPARIPIALLTPEDNAPPEIHRLRTQIHIVSIFIATEKGAPMEEVSEIDVSPEFGLHGDRYGDGRGSWSTPGSTRRQVSFVAWEDIVAASTEMGIPLTPGETRRGIVTHGAKLNELIGKEFAVRIPRGEVRFRGTKPCEPCDRPPLLAGKAIRPGGRRKSFKDAYENRGGLCAEVVSGGTIHFGNEIIIA